MRTAGFELHSHTSISDGELSPVQLLNKSSDYGIDTLAITDHDSIGAYTPETFRRAEELGIRLVPGIEISTRDTNSYRFHILGLGIDIHSQQLNEAIDDMRRSRMEYTTMSCAALNQLGFVVDTETLLAGTASVTKAHIADAILDNPVNEPMVREYFHGELPSRGAFIERIMIEGPAAVTRASHITPERAAQVIHDAGGLAVLAHPMASLFEGVPKDYLLEHMAQMPLDGIEAFSIYYNRSRGNKRVDMINSFSLMAADLGKLVTAGSDYHGSKGMGGKFVDLGFRDEPRIPSRQILNNLLERLS